MLRNSVERGKKREWNQKEWITWTAVHINCKNPGILDTLQVVRSVIATAGFNVKTWPRLSNSSQSTVEWVVEFLQNKILHTHLTYLVCWPARCSPCGAPGWLRCAPRSACRCSATPLSSMPFFRVVLLVHWSRFIIPPLAKCLLKIN